jgi:hypothetical protein
MDTVCHSECKSAINNILGHMFVSQKKAHAIFQKFTLHVVEMEVEKSHLSILLFFVALDKYILIKITVCL